jgi:hypothetical protein
MSGAGAGKHTSAHGENCRHERICDELARQVAAENPGVQMSEDEMLVRLFNAAVRRLAAVEPRGLMRRKPADARGDG